MMMVMAPVMMPVVMVMARSHMKVRNDVMMVAAMMMMTSVMVMVLHFHEGTFYANRCR